MAANSRMESYEQQLNASLVFPTSSTPSVPSASSVPPASSTPCSSSSKSNLQKYKYMSISDLERLSCYYTNATSLRCKINEVQLLASTSKLHIMAITETWFAESSSVHISNYNVYRRDRTSHAGGVCIYVSCDLDS